MAEGSSNNWLSDRLDTLRNIVTSVTGVVLAVAALATAVIGLWHLWPASTPGTGTAATVTATHTDKCKSPYVWREATPDDHVCVTQATHERLFRTTASLPHVAMQGAAATALTPVCPAMSGATASRATISVSSLELETKPLRTTRPRPAGSSTERCSPLAPNGPCRNRRMRNIVLAMRCIRGFGHARGKTPSESRHAEVLKTARRSILLIRPTIPPASSPHSLSRSPQAPPTASPGSGCRICGAKLRCGWSVRRAA